MNWKMRKTILKITVQQIFDMLSFSDCYLNIYLSFHFCTLTKTIYLLVNIQVTPKDYCNIGASV